MHELDAGLPVDTQSWTQMLEVVLFPARVATMALGVLGLMGAMLSITGIFGMAAYSISKRLRELGIRMALGAPRQEVLHAALVGPSSCWQSGRPRGWPWDSSPRACWRSSFIRRPRAIRSCWQGLWWQCHCWGSWQRGFRRNARFPSILRSCCGKTEAASSPLERTASTSPSVRYSAARVSTGRQTQHRPVPSSPIEHRPAHCLRSNCRYLTATRSCCD